MWLHFDLEKYPFTESIPNDDEETRDDIPSIWTMNYIEALILEAAMQRRENARLNEKIALMERRLEAIETEIG